MKKIFILSAILLSTLVSLSQKSTDSTKYYRSELAKLWRQNRDSLKKTAAFQRLSEGLENSKQHSDNYFALTIYGNLSATYYSKINAENMGLGFPAFKDNNWGFGYGFSWKRRRLVYDINVFMMGASKDISSGDKKISTGFSNTFQFEMGYDFIKSNKLNVYPYLGVGLRSAELKYSERPTTNPGYTNITEIILNNASFRETTREAGYQAGLGIEYLLNYTKRTNAGIMLFSKAGTNRAFKVKRFNISGLEYDPEFMFGDWSVSLGLKFIGR